VDVCIDGSSCSSRIKRWQQQQQQQQQWQRQQQQYWDQGGLGS
jgi:hypothetical protein